MSDTELQQASEAFFLHLLKKKIMYMTAKGHIFDTRSGKRIVPLDKKSITYAFESVSVEFFFKYFWLSPNALEKFDQASEANIVKLALKMEAKQAEKKAAEEAALKKAEEAAKKRSKQEKKKAKLLAAALAAKERDLEAKEAIKKNSSNANEPVINGITPEKIAAAELREKQRQMEAEMERKVQQKALRDERNKLKGRVYKEC